MAKITKSTGRSVKEWVGSSPDAKVPPAVRLRILRRFEGKCYLTKIIIADGQPFDLEHIKPLEEGGQHAESNLAPVLRLAHEIKTAAERKRQAKADRVARKAHGLTAPKQKINSPGFPAPEKKKSKRAELPPLPPRRMFVDI